MGRLSKAKPHQLRNVSLSSLLTSRSRGHHPPFLGTKIVATLGPSCCDLPALVRMLESGMSVARIDLTWGPIAFHRRSLDNLQQAMRACRKLCGVMVDTLGRELMIKRRFVLGADGWVRRLLAGAAGCPRVAVRGGCLGCGAAAALGRSRCCAWCHRRSTCTRTLPAPPPPSSTPPPLQPKHDETLSVAQGAAVTITTRQVEASPGVLPVTYPKLPQLVEPGDDIYVGRWACWRCDGAARGWGGCWLAGRQCSRAAGGRWWWWCGGWGSWCLAGRISGAELGSKSDRACAPARWRPRMCTLLQSMHWHWLLASPRAGRQEAMPLRAWNAATALQTPHPSCSCMY
jgi:hypothetical protein